MRENIEVGFQAFVDDAPEEFGAIRAISADAAISPSTSRTPAISWCRRAR
jgi:hypothetical protein